MKSPASSNHNPLPALQPGDILLYNEPRSFIDWAIRVRTWSDVAHVEIYMGRNISFASRNGKGFNAYPTRYHGLQYVRRPVAAFNGAKCAALCQSLFGTPYGWGDLFRFYLWDVPTRGIICSTAATLVLSAGRVECFAEDYSADVVSPRDFQITPAAKTIWSASCTNRESP